MRLALAQIDTVVGDLDGNRDRILARLARGARGGRGPRPLPRARGHRLSARGPAAPARRSSARPSARSRDRRRGDGHRRARRRPAPSTATSTTRAPSARTARCEAVYRKRFLPNYGVFDEERYFAPGRRARPAPPRRDARRGDDLRGHVAAGPAGDRPRARRRAAARQRLGLAVPRRQGPRARGDVRSSAPATTPASSRSATPSAARTSSSSTATPSSSTTRARSSRARPGFEEALLVVDVDPTAAMGGG